MTSVTTRRVAFCHLILLVLTALKSAPIAQGANFVRLGTLGAGDLQSRAVAISADGTVVAGYSSTTFESPLEAVRWDVPALVISPLRNPIVEDGLSRTPTGVSSDGQIVVGFTATLDEAPLTEVLPFRWTASSGVQLLPLPVGANLAAVRGVSDDGAVLIVAADVGAFRWTANGGYSSLGMLPTEPSAPKIVFAEGISRDGSVIVGTSSSGFSDEAYRWTPDEGMTGLGFLAGGLHNYSSASDVSADGKTIVGFSFSSLAPASGEAFVWTLQTGMTGLGFLENENTRTTAEFVSADGRLVFGYAFSPGRELKTFVWTQNMGMRDFTDVLAQDFGLATALTGWTEIRPQDIAGDGRSIVGWGLNPAGRLEAWLVRLDHPIGVPEPPTAAFAAFAILTLCPRRTRCS